MKKEKRILKIKKDKLKEKVMQMLIFKDNNKENKILLITKEKKIKTKEKGKIKDKIKKNKLNNNNKEVIGKITTNKVKKLINKNNKLKSTKEILKI
jgi:hypothetical protein